MSILSYVTTDEAMLVGTQLQI